MNPVGVHSATLAQSNVSSPDADRSDMSFSARSGRLGPGSTLRELFDALVAADADGRAGIGRPRVLTRRGSAAPPALDLPRSSSSRRSSIERAGVFHRANAQGR